MATTYATALGVSVPSAERDTALTKISYGGESARADIHVYAHAIADIKHPEGRVPERRSVGGRGSLSSAGGSHAVGSDVQTYGGSSRRGTADLVHRLEKSERQRTLAEEHGAQVQTELWEAIERIQQLEAELACSKDSEQLANSRHVMKIRIFS